MSRPPLLVVVSGMPASGKTTLARELAKRLELPLVEKDEVKEALFDTLGTRDVALSQRLDGELIELDTTRAVDVAELAVGLRPLL